MAFHLQAFNSSLSAGGRQEREDDGLEVEVAVLDNCTMCPAGSLVQQSLHQQHGREGMRNEKTNSFTIC